MSEPSAKLCNPQTDDIMWGQERSSCLDFPRMVTVSRGPWPVLGGFYWSRAVMYSSMTYQAHP